MKSKFIERYQELYDVSEDESHEDDLVLLERIRVNFNDEYLQEGIVQHNLEGSDQGREHSLCNIFIEFIFDDNDSIYSDMQVLFDQMLLLQHLGKGLGERPGVDGVLCYGCPFASEHVGYFNVPMDFERIDRILASFARFESGVSDDVLDEEYLKKNHSDVYDIYVMRKTEFESILRSVYLCCFSGEPLSVSSVFPELVHDCEDVLFDETGAIAFGFNKKSLNTIVQKISRTPGANRCLSMSENLVCGNEYCFASSDRHVLTISTRILDNVRQFVGRLGIGELSFEQFKFNSSFVLFESYDEDFWVMIAGIKGKQEDYLIKEREMLKVMYDKISILLPPDLIVNGYSYQELTDDQFESMCRDLLFEIGFINIKQRGKINASDGGVDIEADLVVDAIFEKRTERWIFQCKHTKSQIDRKDVSEIPDLLKEFDADRYGVFYSGSFSPQTIDRLKRYKAQYWGQGELNIELRRFNRTAIRYFGF